MAYDDLWSFFRCIAWEILTMVQVIFGSSADFFFFVLASSCLLLLGAYDSLGRRRLADGDAETERETETERQRQRQRHGQEEKEGVSVVCGVLGELVGERR